MLHPSTELLDGHEYTSSTLQAFRPMETKFRASRDLHSGPSSQMHIGRIKQPSKQRQPHLSDSGFLQAISSFYGQA
jgi:hypothetical protein